MVTAEPLTQEFIDRAMRLPERDRGRLASLLLRDDDERQFTEQQIMDEWRQEIGRRLEASRNGEMTYYTLEETLEFMKKVDEESRGDTP